MVQDIKIDIEETPDLIIENGDFVIVDSDPQHIILLMNTNQGAWKQSPTCGVGINQYSGSTGQGAILSRSIKLQLTADGYGNVDVFLEQDSGGRFEYSITADRL